MNRYHTALCPLHQQRRSVRGTTQELQELVRQRHTDEVPEEVPELRTVKDWISVDLETWGRVIRKKEREERERKR